MLFWEIFERESGKHIGNIKFEPIIVQEKYAVVGIMIGEKDFRSKEVAPEILKSSATWLKENLGI